MECIRATIAIIDYVYIPLTVDNELKACTSTASNVGRLHRVGPSIVPIHICKGDGREAKRYVPSLVKGLAIEGPDEVCWCGVGVEV